MQLDEEDVSIKVRSMQKCWVDDIKAYPTFLISMRLTYTCLFLQLRQLVIHILLLQVSQDLKSIML